MQDQYQQQHIYIPLNKLSPIKIYLQDGKFIQNIDSIHNQSQTRLQMITIAKQSQHQLEKNIPFSEVASDYFAIIKYVNDYSSQIPSKQFFKIFSVNLQDHLLKNNQFYVQSLIREQGQISLEDILFLIQQQENHQDYFQLIQLTYSILDNVNLLIQKHINFLNKLDPLSLKFYLSKKSDSEQNYRVIIGLQTIKFSCERPQSFEGYIKFIYSQIKELNHFEMPEKQGHCLKLPKKVQNFINEKSQKQKKDETTKQSLQYCSLLLNHLIKYASDVYKGCQLSIEKKNDLVKIVKQKKMMKNQQFNQQMISLKDPFTNQVQNGNIYQNIYCDHFQGFSKKSFNNKENCPICQEKILINLKKADLKNKNNLVMCLRDSFLRKNQTNIVYFFRQNVFKFVSKRPFANFAHFCSYFKNKSFIRNRPELNVLLKFQRISLLSKLWGKKKIFKDYELILTPVRGKYCKHTQFYDLLRVYNFYMQNSQKESFDCFICLQPILFEEIIYLKEMELIIQLAKQLFYTKETSAKQVNLQIDHHMKELFLISQMEGGLNRNKINLDIYSTIMDPLCKSQFKQQNWKQIQLNSNFIMFFFS